MAGNLTSAFSGKTGTAFPASPKTNTYFDRTDLGIRCWWDGTRWLGPEVIIAAHNYRGTIPYSSSEEILASSVRSDRALYITRFSVSYYTGGGVDASNHWRVTLRRLTSGVSVEDIVYAQTTSNDWHKLADKVPADMSNNPLNTTDIWLQVYLLKTGAPNAIYPIIQVVGRYVYT